MDALTHIGWHIQQPENWRPLRLLNLYRLILAGLFLTLILNDDSGQLVGSYDPILFRYTAIIYLVLSILFSFAIRKQFFQFSTQVTLQFATDLIAITMLMHTSGGITSGLGLLLVVSVVGSSMLVPRRIAVLFGSLASLFILGEEGYSSLNQLFASTHYTNAGILGATLLGTALAVNFLAQRIIQTEALAKQRSLDLADLEQLNEYIIQHMQTGIVVVDEHAHIRLMNESAWNLLATPSNVNNQSLDEISLVLADQLQVWQANPETEHITFRSSKTSPEILPKFARLGSGSSGGFLIFLEDTSAMAQRAQQMKLASLGKLTASIAHEIRNPLGAISHASQLLNESPAINTDDQRLTQIISNHAQRMNTIIENVMSLSRRNRAEPVLFELNDWLENFCEEFISSEQTDPADLMLHKTGKLLDVRMDPGQLNQVAWNLVRNGLRHSQDYAKQPKIELKAGLSADASKPYLDIIDHGPGISPEQSLHIFEPFYTTESSGVGLGLYIARELCEGNRARLDYIAIPSGGSCFRITFADPRRKQTDIL